MGGLVHLVVYCLGCVFGGNIIMAHSPGDANDGDVVQMDADRTRAICCVCLCRD